ncbi:hypothetical protein D3C86_1556000 [compost metagenome]
MFGYALATSQIQEIIFKKEIKRLLTDSPNWEEVDSVIAKYPQINGERIIGLSVVRYYGEIMNKLNPAAREIENAVEAATIYDDRFQGGNYNAWAWVTFEKSNDKRFLEKALEWSKKDIMRQDSTNRDYGVYLDTYANLLYKLGRTEEAIRFQTKAVNIRPDDDELKEHLNKMRKNIPTWDIKKQN